MIATIGMIVSIVIGFFMLTQGADFLVEGATKLAKKCRISPMVIGLTIVAAGTSMPELGVSVMATYSGSTDISVGNIVGSNIVNILFILGVCALILPMKFHNAMLYYDTPFLIVVSGLVFFFGYDGQIGWMEGLILLIIFFLYLLFLFGRTKWVNQENQLHTENALSAEEKGGCAGKWWMIMAYIIGGLAILIIGSKLVVYGASEIATIIGISERVIGLTIVAVGTSLPELMASIMAAKKGTDDIAIGNIVGSNIFNALVILGVTALMKPVSFSVDFRWDALIMVATAAVLFLISLPNRKLTRLGGGFLLTGYVVYVAFLIMR